jgi:16S rRNA (guanine527-N7)-methyltransferase
VAGFYRNPGCERGAGGRFTLNGLAQLQQFGRYYELLILANNQFNLTALTSPEDVAVKHMIDSLLALDDVLSLQEGQER